MRNTLLILLVSICAATQAQNAGDQIFNSGPPIHEIRITFPFSNWYDTLISNHTIGENTGSSIYAMGSLQLDDIAIDSVGFKFKGNSSFNNPNLKKSWKISTEEFIDSNEVDDLNEFNLNNGFKDPSFMREKLCLDFLNDYGIPAPRCDYANVYVNEELFGFYAFVEEVDKKFLKTHFGNKGGNLYKGDPHGDLRWLGSSTTQYQMNYEKATNEAENDWSDLIWFIDNLNNSSTADFIDSLDSSFNTEQYVRSWASMILFSNFDSYCGSGHNYFIYHNSDSNQFEFINWDVNEAFGNFNLNMSISDMATVPLDYIPTPASNRPLNFKMLPQNIYWDQYRNFLCNALSDYFNPSHMNVIIDSLQLAIQSHFSADPNKLYTDEQFVQNISFPVNNTPGIKQFVADRYEYLLGELEYFSCSPISNIASNQVQNDWLAYPNPTGDTFYLQSPSEFDFVQCILYNQTGQIVKCAELKSTTRTEIDMRNLPVGLYFLGITGNDGKSIQKKIIKTE